VINTSLHPTSHIFRDMVDYWSNFRFDRGGGFI